MITNYNLGEYGNMIFYMLLMVSLIFLIKYIHGDFSPISVEEVNRDTIPMKNEKGDIIGKKIIYEYRYTYNDNRIKYKTKIVIF